MMASHSAHILVAPYMFCGATALSLETSRTFWTPDRNAAVMTFWVPWMFVLTTSEGS